MSRSGISKARRDRVCGRQGTWGIGGVRCRIMEGCEGAGREGEAVCYFEAERRLWLVVFMDDEEDPDVHKASCMQIKHPGERHWEKVE